MQSDSEFRDSSVYDHELVEDSAKFELDFITKLKIENEVVDEEQVEEEDDEEEEFSFVLVNPDGSPISADDAFDNGQIRQIYPVFDQNLLSSDGHYSPVKKVFVQKTGDSSSAAASEGTYCEWSPKTAVKSNSTGTSKVWKFRDVKLRSNSDGKDAFVFLNSAAAEKASPTGVVVKKVKAVKGKTTTSTSAHEKHYVLNRAKKESDKRKSYLPYRQELFGGFFASTNGMHKSLHPY